MNPCLTIIKCCGISYNLQNTDVSESESEPEMILWQETASMLQHSPAPAPATVPSKATTNYMQVVSPYN